MTSILLIGYGAMGRIHARVLKKMNLLSGIVEPAKSNAELAKKEYVVPVYSSLEECDLEIDGVVIAVPTQFHSDVAKEVIKKYPGIKGILLEKPISPSLEEATQLAEVLKNYIDRVIVGHVEVYNPVVTKFLELINSGELGRIRTFMVFRKGSVPVSRLQSLSGVLVDIGVHDFDIISRLIGGDIKLYATGTYHGDSLNTALINFKGEDFHGVIHLSREFSGKEREIVVECELASVKVDLIAQTIEIRGRTAPEGNGVAISIPHRLGSSLKLYGEPLLEELLNLRAIIEEDAKPVVGITEGLKTLKIVEACRASVSAGVPVDIKM